jgi:hypothetical protein
VSAPELKSTIKVLSEPGSADIEVDGAFVGNTPSTIQVLPGSHQLIVKKVGFKEWSRTVNVTGGDINISAELQKAE